MKAMLIFLFTGLVTISYSQNASENKFTRKGFIFGAAVGMSALNLNFTAYPNQSELSASLPNFKIGAMVSKRTALLLYLPGSIYTYKNDDRTRDRGFEAIVPSVQYWFTDHWWILGGVGLGMDAPAFYDIKNEDERTFYFGLASVTSVGYEVWRKGKFALDVQSRVHYGTANRPEGMRSGLAFDFLIGFNWY
ncbi:MAG TPA: hypothetical protein VIT44_13880 [Cyclobacteriaceae bacterium]